MTVQLQKKCNEISRTSIKVQLGIFSIHFWFPVLIDIATNKADDVCIFELNFNLRGIIFSFELSLTLVQLILIFVLVSTFINDNTVILIGKIVIKLHLLLLDYVLSNDNSFQI
jgi:hypothetical protein